MKTDITAQTVADWAEGTLEEWLPGYTDYLDEHGCQFRIKLMTDGTYQVEPMRGYNDAARYFRVIVTVVEEPT